MPLEFKVVVSVAVVVLAFGFMLIDPRSNNAGSGKWWRGGASDPIRNLVCRSAVTILCILLARVDGALAAPQAVMVAKNSGTLSCFPSPVSLQEMGKILTENGIQVLSASCASDGLYRCMACNCNAGLFYVYEIETHDVGKAVSLGFDDISKLDRYKLMSCQRPNPSPQTDGRGAAPVGQPSPWPAVGRGRWATPREGN